LKDTSPINYRLAVNLNFLCNLALCYAENLAFSPEEEF
jgi:hypothetical protein